jgi:hypothetical protein
VYRVPLIVTFVLLTASSAGAESGLASYYGGRGQRGDMTCAHRTRAFGSTVTVTYAGRSIRCRVNDRGPVYSRPSDRHIAKCGPRTPHDAIRRCSRFGGITAPNGKPGIRPVNGSAALWVRPYRRQNGAEHSGVRPKRPCRSDSAKVILLRVAADRFGSGQQEAVWRDVGRSPPVVPAPIVCVPFRCPGSLIQIVPDGTATLLTYINQHVISVSQPPYSLRSDHARATETPPSHLPVSCVDSAPARN